MYIQIRDVDNFAINNVRTALVDAGVTQTSVVAYNGEIHIDVWQKLRNSDVRNVVETLGFYGIHPYAITN